MTAKARFDPITLEILWSRLISIADESATALLRSSFSTIVRESNDFATVLMDSNGDSLSENTVGIPSFVGLLPRILRNMLAAIPKEEWKPGDCIITNDPWLATGHLLDISMAAPIFYRDRLIGFSGSTAHLPDIGGASWAADCGEIFEEGLRILPVRFLKQGKENRDVSSLIRSNVRVPDQVIGDIYAQVSAQMVCANRLCEFMDDTGLEDLTELSLLLQDRADQAMRKAIGELPDGTYHGSVNADGFGDDETHIQCAITIEGETLEVDYEGTSAQIARGLNSVMNYTRAYTVYPIKCALDPLTPRNEGSYRSVSVQAPEGSILNPRYPAATSARHLTGHFLSYAVFDALSKIVPDKVIAASSSPNARGVFSGVNADGDRFSQVLFGSGGMGASSHADGLSGMPFPTNTGAGSIEALESSAPILVWRKNLLTDSGGAGQFRGGLGQEIEVEILSSTPVRLSMLSDHNKYPPTGLLGGHDGTRCMIESDRQTVLHPKARTVMQPGERLKFQQAGGGGFGDPRKRAPEAVRKDIENGYVSAEAASQVYGYREMEN